MTMGLERTFAVVVGVVLIALGVLGSLGSPLAGGPDHTSIIVTGFGHDLVHLVSGALFLHVGLALNGRNRALGLIVLGAFYVATAVLSVVSGDLFGLYGAHASGLDQLAHLLLGVAATTVGWMGRSEERREYGRAVSRPIRH